MSAEPEKAQLARRFSFPDWPEVLAQAPLSPAHRQGYGITLRWYGDRPSKEVGEAEPHGFLDGLAQVGQVSASTQRQALNALVFLFREVMARQPGDFSDYQRAVVRQRLPVVLTREDRRLPIANSRGAGPMADRRSPTADGCERQFAATGGGGVCRGRG